MERQRVVDEYRNKMMEGMNLIPLESNLHKYDPVIISQIINMIEADNFWHRKMFESVMSDLWNMWMEGIRELENTHMLCTNNDKNKNEMVGVEVIDLCSASQSKITEVCYLLEVSWQMCHAWITHWTIARAILTMSRRRSTHNERTHGRDVREPLLAHT